MIFNYLKLVFRLLEFRLDYCLLTRKSLSINKTSFKITDQYLSQKSV